jgi:hypothetical protein
MAISLKVGTFVCHLNSIRVHQSVDCIGRRERNENESGQRRAPLTESEMMPVDDDQSGIRNEFLLDLKEMAPFLTVKFLQFSCGSRLKIWALSTYLSTTLSTHT